MNTSTITVDQVYQEMLQLPSERLSELATFVKFLRFKSVLDETEVTELTKSTALPQYSPQDDYPFYVHPQQEIMQHEVETFEALHETLWQRYPNQYIAMQGGQVVDSDPNELALLERIEGRYPDQIVLIRKVTQTLPPDLVIRSPRFVD